MTQLWMHRKHSKDRKQDVGQSLSCWLSKALSKWEHQSDNIISLTCSFTFRIISDFVVYIWNVQFQADYATALTIHTERFPSCRCCCISFVALFKHYLTIDLNGAHSLSCAVASIQTKKRQRGPNFIRPASLIWYYCGDRKSASFISLFWEVQNIKLQLWCLWFERSNASIRQGALILERNFEHQETKPSSKLAHWSPMLKYQCFICDPIYRCIVVGAGYACCYSTWVAAVTGLTGCVCFHLASLDWAMTDGQSITQEAPWPVTRISAPCVTSSSAVSHFSLGLWCSYRPHFYQDDSVVSKSVCVCCAIQSFQHFRSNILQQLLARLTQNLLC